MCQNSHVSPLLNSRFVTWRPSPGQSRNRRFGCQCKKCQDSVPFGHGHVVHRYVHVMINGNSIVLHLFFDWSFLFAFHDLRIKNVLNILNIAEGICEYIL